MKTEGMSEAEINARHADKMRRKKEVRDKIIATNPNAITRRPTKDLYLTTCVPGLSQLGEAYQLAPGTEVNFLAEGGSIGRNDRGNLPFVKEHLPAADKCGGIDTWTVPAAQLGASFIVDAQAAIFDPFAARVWLPK